MGISLDDNRRLSCALFHSAILLFSYSSPLLLPIILLVFRGHSEVRLDLLPIARATTTGAAPRSVTPRPPILLPPHTLSLFLSHSLLALSHASFAVAAIKISLRFAVAAIRFD